MDYTNDSIILFPLDVDDGLQRPKLRDDTEVSERLTLLVEILFIVNHTLDGVPIWKSTGDDTRRQINCPDHIAAVNGGCVDEGFFHFDGHGVFGDPDRDKVERDVVVHRDRVRVLDRTNIRRRIGLPNPPPDIIYKRSPSFIIASINLSM